MSLDKTSVSRTLCSVPHDATQSQDPSLQETRTPDQQRTTPQGQSASKTRVNALTALRRIRERNPYLPGRSSRLSSPAAMLRPIWPCKLSGCSAIEFAEPPTSTLPPTPMPSVALPWAPT